MASEYNVEVQDHEGNVYHPTPDILSTKEELMANNDAGKTPDALLVKQLNSDLSFPDGTGFYPDMQNGVAGYNTDRARGADTFVPFSSSVEFSFCLREYGTELSSVRMECSLYSKLQIDNYKFSGNSRTAYIYGIMEDGSRETIATISGSTNPITLNYDISAYTQVEITSPNGGALSTSGDGKLYN